MQLAVIQGTDVVNIIEGDPTFTLDGFAIVPLAEPGYIGGTYSNGVFSAPPAPPAVVPESVSARQFHFQLSVAGLRAQVIAWIGTQPVEVQDAFEYSGSFVRNEPMMETGFAALGYTSAQIDAFFTAAALL
ncbi:hypothetical protein P9228_06245 [Mesorhizobium sp. WSM4898]|uniref:hypothetical protein n=1 Tax=Mesorhizobium sp. WSM4898 TaxID=3038544 RepID=UPI0024154C6B|nr:hypothetical protein [Mesorhizobium sp. WSM4898]MDG4906049.1 hypothetical protein [Mesorhizobium sp. WSM4898]